MKPTFTAARRSLFAAFALTAAGGAAAVALTMPSGPSLPSATAAPDPCAASEVARTVGSVAMSTGNYLDTHPQTNQTLTTISQSQGGPQSLGALKSYFDANPQVAKEMQALQQPLVNLSGKCKLPITIPQLLGLMQAAQSQGGGLPGAQAVGVPGAAPPALRSPASASTTGTGPLPGPATTAAG
jgi:heme-binding protein